MTSRKIIFFWRPHEKNGVFGNWYKSPFEANSVRFNCVEQYIMYSKANLFEDPESAERIMKTLDPAKHKSLGRRVQNFDDQLWDKNKERILYEGLYAKFTQNPEMMQALLETGDSILAEASPLDKIYGIGLAWDHPDASNPKRWKGQNLLGVGLMQVRQDIKSSLDKGEKKEKGGQ